MGEEIFSFGPNQIIQQAKFIIFFWESIGKTNQNGQESKR